MSCILFNLKVHYRVYKGPPLSPVLSLTNSVHDIPFCFSKIHLILPSHLLGLPTTMYAVLMFTSTAECCLWEFGTSFMFCLSKRPQRREVCRQLVIGVYIHKQATGQQFLMKTKAPYLQARVQVHPRRGHEVPEGEL